MKHVFQVGDRVVMLDYDYEKGTVFTVDTRPNGQIIVGVSPDDQEKFQKQFEPLEKMEVASSMGKVEQVVSLYVAPENLELISGNVSDPEWKDIWDSN